MLHTVDPHANPAATAPCADVVRIDLGERSYPIYIADQLLSWSSSPAWADLPAGSQAVIVTNTTVGPLYAQRLRERLVAQYAAVQTVILPDGECHKDWTTLQRIFDALLVAECDRSTVMYALGGGVVGDMAGFAAACYMRGVRFVQIPTTLLSQVDSSVGGKTGINHALGKNMIGAFYQPQRVICDLSTLTTLPTRELSAGIAEIIKYGPIADATFFEWLESNLDALMALEPTALSHAVRRSCEIKAQVVGQDEREGGVRAILNFGHTFGHAIEAGMGYGQWLHGEAVACGMVMAADLSARLGLVEPAFVDRLRTLCLRAKLPVTGPAWEASAYLGRMRIDKKAQAGEIRFVLLDAVGHAIVRPAPDAVVLQTLAACTA